MASVSSRIEEAMDAAGMSAATLAERLGLAGPEVTRWLTGKSVPPEDALAAIAEALDVDPGWLEFGEGRGPLTDLEEERAEYRAERYWGFKRQSPEGDRDYGNANVWAFKPNLGAFVREVGQNILDVISGNTATVKMRVITLEGPRLDDFNAALDWESLETHLAASVASGQKQGKALGRALERLEQDGRLVLLRIEEQGTSGLTGTEVTETGAEPSNFAALCRNNLDSAKRGETAGGAFGLGKAVLWRTSGLSTVLFNSDLAIPEGGRTEGRLFGRSELAFHEMDGQGYAGPGWLGREQNNRAESYWGNHALARDLLLAREPGRAGTTIMILGFHDPSAEEDSDVGGLAEGLDRAWCEHFWPAIAEDRLDVWVETGEGGGAAETETATHVQPALIEPEFIDMIDKYKASELSDSLETEGDVVKRTVTLTVPAMKDGSRQRVQHEAVVLVRRAPDNPGDEATSPNRVAFYRGTGMVISTQDKSRIRVGARPFHAAVLCGEAAGDTAEDRSAEVFLRAAEPPSHNAWELSEEVKATYEWGAGARINEFYGEVFRAIADLVGPAAGDLSDGPRGLKELLKVTTRNDEPKGPRVGSVSAQVVDGRWEIEAVVHAQPVAPQRWQGKPLVRLAAEERNGGSAEWESLEAISDCEINDDNLLTISVGKKRAKFRGRTRPGTHVISAERAAVSVEFVKATRVSGDEAGQ